MALNLRHPIKCLSEIANKIDRLARAPDRKISAADSLSQPNKRRKSYREEFATNDIGYKFVMIREIRGQNRRRKKNPRNGLHKHPTANANRLLKQFADGLFDGVRVGGQVLRRVG